MDKSAIQMQSILHVPLNCGPCIGVGFSGRLCDGVSLVSGKQRWPSLTDAVLQVVGQLEAGVADALETPLSVDAASVATHDPVHDALVNV